MKRLIQSSILAACGMVLFSGCTTTGTTPANTASEPAAAPAQQAQPAPAPAPAAEPEPAPAATPAPPVGGGEPDCE